MRLLLIVALLVFNSAQEEERLTHKAKHQSYDSIIEELTVGRSPEAILKLTQIMNNEELTREERNVQLDEWGDDNQCEDAVGVFKIKEELIDDEEKKERVRLIDMLTSVAHQIRDMMLDPEMADYEKKEMIGELVDTVSEKIKPLLHALYPSLSKEQLSSDEIIEQHGHNTIDELHELNEIITEIIYHRDDESMVKKRHQVEGFIRNAKNHRVADVLRILWSKMTRRRRDLHSKYRRGHVIIHQKHLKNWKHRPTKLPPFFNKDFS